MNTEKKTMWRLLSVSVGVFLWLTSAATAADPAPRPVLHLTNDGYAAGEPRASDDPRVLRWRSPAFARPLDFPLSVVNAVHYPVPGPPPKPAGEYCFELADDDVLYGDLLGLTEDEVKVRSPRLGLVHLRREQVRRLYRWQGADLVYLGPNGLAGWKDPAATPRWHDEGGQLVTDQPGATVFGDLGLPERAVIEFELSWKQPPDFVFALGVDDRDATAKQAFRFEVLRGELVAVGESARDADLAPVLTIGPGEGRVRLQAYLDQKQRRLILLTRGGKHLATLAIDDNKPQVHPGVRLTSTKGDLRLEHLRVTRWNGVPPREARDQARLHRTDGSVVYGRLVAFDPDSKQFTVRDGTEETRVKQDTVADVFLSPPADRGGSARPAPGGQDRTLRVVYRDGSRLSGTPTRIEDAHVNLNCPGVKEPLRLPLDGVRSLIPLWRGGGVETPSPAGRLGRLELDGLRLKGWLADASGPQDAGGLVWHPDLCLNASALLRGQSGRIVYRDPPPKPSAAELHPAVPGGPGIVVGVGQGQAVMVGNQWVVVGQAVGNARPSTPPTVRPPSTGRPSLHLRSGDTIPCEVVRIDEKGVTFKSPVAKATFVEHDKIKSIELAPAHDESEITEAKRDRLLTLPRMQKPSPPTHLICSKNGDFLRGRIVEMDDAKLKIEVRLETREVPRDRVAQIIWLHPDELTGGKPAPAAGPPPADRVQTLRSDGKRMTFVLEGADHQTIFGTSDVLGAYRADLAGLDQLLFGKSIEQSAEELADHRWKLHPAPEPKYVQAEAAGASGPSGTESPLVGQPAFAFRLDRLDGGTFHLADRKGKVIVLDFWATWCGPCLQSLPLVEGVVREFADKGVELVAVNMEEQPQQVRAMLERHKLNMPVVLDRDGVVAAKYAVTAIPQTVVIDREGKVARLYVGGGKNTAESLRKALQELTGAPPAPAAAP